MFKILCLRTGEYIKTPFDLKDALWESKEEATVWLCAVFAFSEIPSVEDKYVYYEIVECQDINSTI